MPRISNWPRLAWWGFLLISLAIILNGIPATSHETYFLANAPEELAQLQLSEYTAGILSFIAFFLRILLIAGFLTAAGLIFLHRTEGRPGLIFSAALIAIGVTNGVINYLPEPTPAALRAYEIISDLFTMVFLYTFPDGKFQPRWVGWLLAPWLAYLVINQMDLLPGDATEDIIDLLFLATGISALVYRFRISAAEQRQQIKWVVFGSAAIILIAYALNLLHFAALAYFSPASPLILVYEVFRTYAQILTLLILPTVLTISILRYHLWDIDFFINRSLVYGFLTVLLGIVFFGTALLLQILFNSIFGSQYTSIGLTASAVIIAILFQPARQQLQTSVDRRFFGIRPYTVPQADPANAPIALIEPLSPRELDVLRFVEAGLSNREIAGQLFLTTGTVKWHTNNIYTKLGVSSRTQALARAREYQLLKNQASL
ncbi:MAG: helix-turn-helix transcriptional regulator [Anaerolineales bacterium]